MLEVTNLYKSFRSVRAVNGLSLQVQAGEIVGLLGPNGAGKTTTLRCICGILRPDAGQIVVGGYDLATQQQQAKRLMAFIPEVPNPYELLTVREHIQFVAMCYGTMDTFRERIEELLHRFDLKEKEHELAATLSKGMRQKLAVACAFVHNAKVFLCDEPLIGIDPKGQHELKSELQRLRDEGCAILVSTHQLDTAERLCDRVIIMQAGRKLAEGTLAELQEQAQMADSTLEQVFLRLTEEAQDASAVVSHVASPDQ
ncbi:MAG: multidrug ABC transporter ATP-binding protein [Armatimonadota bacterium]|nr:MAG: multidrug ABC transporter ATP-binding protein [Armatimonadota bacterium]